MISRIIVARLLLGVGLLLSLAGCGSSEPPKGGEQPALPGQALAPTREPLGTPVPNATVDALKNLATVITVFTPAALPGVDGDVPKPPDGKLLYSLPGVDTIQTSLSVTDTLSFYDKALTAQGWKKGIQQTYATNAMQVVYNKDNKDSKYTMTIVVGSNGDATTATLGSTELK